MSSPRIGFKRMLVGLPQGMANPASVEAAVDLAEFLQIELLATFVADASLLELAGLTAARELRTLDQEWQPLELARISRDLKSAAGVARRRFADSVKSRTIKTSFDVVAQAQMVASRIRADDIVAIIEPSHPGETITRQCTGLLDAAFASAGAVLVVPTRIARTTGPIMVTASDPEEPSIRAALAVAAALKERLIVVTPPGTRLPIEVLAEAEQLGVLVEHIASGGLRAEASLAVPALARLQERLRIVTRDVLTDWSPRLFSSLQGIPLLVIEPGRA